jgi:hypothetical protein
MKNQLLFYILLIFSGLYSFSCKKKEDAKPIVKPLPIDTAAFDQYVICTMDTIPFASASKGGLPASIFLKKNFTEVTIFYAETEVRRGLDISLSRNIEFALYDFQSKKQGTYIGAKIFANAKTDLLVGNVDSETKNWEIINEPTNRIQVTRVDSTTAFGRFNFKMRNTTNPKEFMDVKDGIFKVRYR